MARFDLVRLVEGCRNVAGDEVAELARRDYGGDPVSDVEWAKVFAAFGPTVLNEEELARRIPNRALGEPGMRLLRQLDVVDQLARITCPTLACVGGVDPVTPVAASREIIDGLRPGVGQLVVIDGAGHFPWLDRPEDYQSCITSFLTTATQAHATPTAAA